MSNDECKVMTQKNYINNSKCDYSYDYNPNCQECYDAESYKFERGYQYDISNEVLIRDHSDHALWTHHYPFWYQKQFNK
jgi:hypothetical protein